MIFSRNIAYIKNNGPKFLSDLGSLVLGQDSYMLELQGGTVSFLVREKENPEIIYVVHLTSWFGDLQLKCMFPATVAEQHNINIRVKK